jgi:glutamine synthetase
MLKPPPTFYRSFLSLKPTVVVTCDVIEPSTMQGYDRDPRSIARRAEEYLKSTGIGDTAFFGPEPEFFVFDEVKWSIDMSGARHTISLLKKLLGQPTKTTKAVTMVTVHVSKAVTSQYHPLIASQDMRADMCAAVSKRSWAQAVLKSITTKLHLAS